MAVSLTSTPCRKHVGWSKRAACTRQVAGSTHLAVFAADRDVFAVSKHVVAEVIAGLVVVLRRLVIVE